MLDRERRVKLRLASGCHVDLFDPIYYQGQKYDGKGDKFSKNPCCSLSAANDLMGSGNDDDRKDARPSAQSLVKVNVGIYRAADADIGAQAK